MLRRKFLVSLAAASLALGSWSVSAQQLGRDYAPLKVQQPTEDASKVEVLEFFSYGCSHCASFHPLLTQWAAKLPKDVVLKKIPVTFNSAKMVPMAKLYYALEASGDLGKLDAAVFDSIHKQGVALMTDQAVIDWAAKRVADPKKFEDAYKSFGVKSKVDRAQQLVQAYGVNGTPSMAIDGKYMVNNETTSLEDRLKVTEQLVNKARQEKVKK